MTSSGTSTDGDGRLAQDPVQVALGDQHLPRLRALVPRHDPTPLEHVDQPPGAGVADPQPPLDERDGRRLVLGDEADRILEHRIVVGVQRSRVRGLRARLEQLLLERGLGLAAARGHDLRRLGLRDERALHALELGRPERLVEHVALAEERLGAVHVEDHARIRLGRDGECDPRGDVRLDHPGDDVDPRALRREHEMDADRPALLREADDRVLDLGGRDHHEVGQLVDDDEHVRDRVLAADGADRVPLGQVAGLDRAHELVAAVHLADDVLEHEGRVLHVRDDGRQEVRDRLVVVELDPLGVDEDHPHLVGRGAKQDRGQDGIDAAGLAGSGCARDQEVRHPGQVAGHAGARDVLAEPCRERARPLGRVLEDVAERHQVRRACWAPRRRPPACPGWARGSGSRSWRARRRGRRGAARRGSPWFPQPAGARSASRAGP